MTLCITSKPIPMRRDSRIHWFMSPSRVNSCGNKKWPWKTSKSLPNKRYQSAAHKPSIKKLTIPNITAFQCRTNPNLLAKNTIRHRQKTENQRKSETNGPTMSPASGEDWAPASAMNLPRSHVLQKLFRQQLYTNFTQNEKTCVTSEQTRSHTEYQIVKTLCKQDTPGNELPQKKTQHRSASGC